MAAPIRVTPELLRQAWQARRRADWPATFEACMADELIGRLVRAKAFGLARAAMDRDRRKPWPPAAAPAPRPQDHPARLRAPAPRDLKRAAAGDASDD